MSRDEEIREQNRQAWASYHERLAAYEAGTLPMRPSPPIRYPFS